MSSPQLSTALGIWRARRGRRRGDTAAALAVSAWIVLVVIVPIMRALWMLLSGPTGIDALTSAIAPRVVSLLAAALWAGALLLGRSRGPALRLSFPLYALTGSGIRRATTLCGPMLRAGMLLTAACASAAALVGLALFAQGEARLGDVAEFVAAGLATGVVTVTLWLVGQAAPRAAAPLALTVLACAVLACAVPTCTGGACTVLASAPQPPVLLVIVAPWAWVSAAYPGAGSGPLPAVALAVLAGAAIAMVPRLLDRLTGIQLAAQAARWERAAAFSLSFEFGAATGVYAAEPRIGRRLRAVVSSGPSGPSTPSTPSAPSGPLWVTFLVRDFIGQLRTPGRALGALAATALAGVALTVSLLPGAPSALLAGAAGAVVYAATGPLTTGLTHAADVSRDYPLYGISDRRLVGLHLLFPLTVLLLALPGAATLTVFATGAGSGIAVWGACALGVLALALRLASALRGPVPLAVLAPVSTPAGDLSIVVLVGWALSGPLLATLGALALSTLPTTPIPLLLLGIWVAGLLAIRWKRRR